VLGAVRSYAITEYAAPKAIGKAVNNPKMLPLLMGIPVVIFLVLGLITGLLDFSPPLGEHGISHSMFFSTWLVDMIFVPLAGWVVIVFAMGLKRFINDIHENAVLEGKTDKQELDYVGLIKALFRVIPTILKQDKFSECSENKDRDVAHWMVFLSFIGLFIVTNVFFVALYGLQLHGPYSQLNPVKWLANISGVALVVGGILMIKNRLSKTDQTSVYKDWYLLGLVLGLGLTGLCILSTWCLCSTCLHFCRFQNWPTWSTEPWPWPIMNIPAETNRKPINSTYRQQRGYRNVSPFFISALLS